MTELIAVAVGGALGAVGRHVLAQWAQARAGADFPVGTLLVNLLGCLLLGAIAAALAHGPAAQERWRLLLGVGLLGSFTTFSTWSFENLALIEHGRWGAAALNVFGQLLLGFAALMIGRAGMTAVLR
ncbi:MAG: putative fluoride ion transporter CrcB [Planctomycetota bacterium]|nr:MAG: putative fluoride ion transporter CrcB [Planctomycetota bacterium]